MTRWGFVATGSIAATVARDLALVEGAVPLAVASRSADRAEAFAREHGFERSYGSYEELLEDGDVDAVYVATPHGQHHRVVSMVLDAGKAVLVEKAFTVSYPAAMDLVERARERGVFCMEAMWTRFLPVIARLRELVADGAVGDVRIVQADLGAIRPWDPASRLWAPELGGGALLDLGVYPVSFAQMLLGRPSSVAAVGALAETGVDADASLLLGWPDGATGLIGTSLRSLMGDRASVTGTAGRIDVDSPFHHPPRITLVREGAEPEVFEDERIGRGYAHQIVEVQRCIAEGLTESPTMPLDDTLAVMAVVDEALAALGSTPVDEGFSRPTP